MRLIDADALLDEIRKSKDGHNHADHEILMNHHMEHDAFMDLVDAAPTVDAVEVVRCKDCKYTEDCLNRIQFWGRNPVLELNTTEYHPLNFCSYGERRDNGTTQV